MGSSKSAQALMTKFNYEQKGFRVLLVKPSIDNRDDNGTVRMVSSRIGLSRSWTLQTSLKLYSFELIVLQCAYSHKTLGNTVIDDIGLY